MTNIELRNSFKEVVSSMFNRWTALRLAVEHGMAGQNGLQVCSNNSDSTAWQCCEVFHLFIDGNRARRVCHRLLLLKSESRRRTPDRPAGRRHGSGVQHDLRRRLDQRDFELFN